MRAKPIERLKQAEGTTAGSPLLIDGQWRDAAGGATFAAHDPFLEEDWGEIADASATDVNDAVEAAKRAFDDGRWSGKLAGERARIMHRLAELIQQGGVADGPVLPPATTSEIAPS